MPEPKTSVTPGRDRGHHRPDRSFCRPAGPGRRRIDGHDRGVDPDAEARVAVDAGTAGKVLRLVDALEDLEDVQAVYANYEVPDDVMAALAG